MTYSIIGILAAVILRDRQEFQVDEPVISLVLGGEGHYLGGSGVLVAERYVVIVIPLDYLIGAGNVFDLSIIE